MNCLKLLVKARLALLHASIISTVILTPNLHGVEYDNELSGTDGNDVLHIGDQNDHLSGLGGADQLHGFGGDDWLEGGSGDDRLQGYEGDDILDGGIGLDQMWGNEDNDILNGGDEADYLDGGSGDDVLNGDGGDDNLQGGLNDDQLNGGSGQDSLVGGAGNDVLNGGDDDDNLQGGLNNDQIVGGNGQDSLIGGAGNDILIGGENDDQYVFYPGDGQDTIHNYDTSGTDILFFEDTITSDRLSYIKIGNDLEIRIDGSSDKVIVKDWFVSIEYQIDYLSGGESNLGIAASYINTQVVDETDTGGGGDSNQAPVANAGSDQAVYVGDVVTLDPNASTDADGDDLTYEWSILNGDGVTLSDGPTANTKQFIALDVAQATIYSYRVTVTDTEGASSTDDINIQVSPIPGPNLPPITDAGPDQVAVPGDIVTIDLSGSYDVDGSLASVRLAYEPGVNLFAQFINAPMSYQFTAPNILTTTIYKITIIFTDNEGAQSSDEVVVTVNPADGNKTPVANAGLNQSVTSFSPVIINSNDSYDPDGDTLTREWAVESGETLNMVEWQEPNSYVFIAPEVSETSVIDFKLTVTDPDGLSHEDTVQITVNPVVLVNQIPVVNAGPDIIITSGHSVILDGSNSYDPDYQTITLDWAVANDAFELIQGGKDNTVQFTAPNVETQTQYIVRLTATDIQGASYVDEVSVIVNPDHSPIANAGADQWVSKGSLIILDGRLSQDPNGQTLQYEWEELSSSNLVFSSSIEKGVAEFIAPEVVTNTSYELKLTVTTEDGRQSTDTLTVQVSPNQAPLLNQTPVANAGPDLVVDIGDTVSIDYSESIDPDGDSLYFRWSWSHNIQDTDFIDPQILEFTAPDVTDTTTIVLTLTVTDSDGLQNIDHVRVTVNGSSGEIQNYAPNASAGLNQTVNIGDLVVLDASETIDPEQDNFTINWSSITDNSISLTLDQNPNIISFTAPDTQYTSDLTFKVTTTDDQGNASSDEVSIRVLGREALPAATVPAADVIVVMDESVSMTGEQLWIGETIRPLHDSLVVRGIGNGTMQNRYGLVGFGTNEYSFKTFSVGGEQYGTAHQFISATQTLQTEGGLEDGWLAVSHALNNYQHRGASALNIILVTDEDRDEVDASVNYESTLASLKAHNALLNAVVKAKFYCGDGREAIGMDASGIGYLANGQGGFETCSNARVENYSNDNDAATTVEDYVNLAMASGGAAWDVIALRYGGHFAQSFTQAIIDIKTQEISNQTPQSKYQAIIDTDPQPAQVNEVISLDGSRSQVADGELGITLYEWDLDLDGSFEIQGVNTSISFAQTGVYPVRLRVSNEGLGIYSDIVTVDLVVAESDLINRPSIITSEPVTHVLDSQTYSYQLTAQDKHSAVTYQLISQIDGMSVDVTTGEISWPNPVQGEYEVSVQAIDDEGLSDAQIYTLKVTHINLAPKIISAHKLNAYENVAYQYQIHAWDPEYETLTFALETAPDRMTIDSVTGVINWNPLIGDIGQHTVTVTATDPWGLFDTQSFQLTVHNVNDGPIITSDAVINAIEDAAYGYLVTFSDLDIGIDLEEQHTFSLNVFPVGMQVNIVTGEISWLPTNDQVGNHNVQVKVTDLDGLFNTQNYTVTVMNVNDAPVITSTQVTQVNERENYYYNVDANDIDIGDKLTYALTTSPSGMSIDANSGAINWIPEIAQIGTHNVTVSVKDIAEAEDTQSYVITVNNVDDAPNIISSAVTSINERATYQYGVNATDLDVGEVLVYSLTESPSGMSIHSSAGLISWVPSSEQLGSHSVKVLVTDSDGLTDTQNYYVQVQNVNDAPSFITQPLLEINERANYDYDSDAQDQDPGDSLTYSLQTAPTGMSISSYYGRVSWAPTFDQLGSHEVVLVVTDRGGLTDTQNYNIQVKNVDDAPNIVSSAITSVPERETYTYDVNATDIDINDALTFSLNESPAGMTINEASGEISWLTSADLLGRHRVTIQVTDLTNLTDTQTFYLTVTDVNEPPSITSSAITTVNEYESYVYDVNATDPDPSESLTYSLIAAPQGMSITSYNGYISWTPEATQVGDHDMTVRVTDKGGLTDEQTFTVDVANKEFAPVFVTTPVTEFYLGDAYYYYAAIATDKDIGEVLTYSLAENPDGLSIDSATGAINWTPLDSQQGNQRVSITVTDSTNLTATQTFNINVIGITANNLAFTTDENVALDIQLLANNLTAGSVTYSISLQPTNGSIIGDGQDIIYLPNKYFEGEDSFQFKVINEYSVSATATVTITVVGKNDPPKILSEPSQKHVLRPTSDTPIPLILSDWEPVELTGVNSTSKWIFEEGGMLAIQTRHSEPVALVGAFDSAYSLIEGTFEVGGDGDDDFIGFVFGYQNTQQFYLLDWKQNQQGIKKGIALKRFNKPYGADFTNGDFWSSTPNNYAELYRNEISYLDGEEYGFSLAFQPGRIAITISNADAVVDTFTIEDSTFVNGRFGFYNYSQQHARFSGFRTTLLANNLYAYPVEAMDPEGQPLTYRLLDAPDGMTIDEETGAIFFLTDENNLGSYHVEIEVEDDQGQTDHQAYDFVVTNDVPIIVTKPKTSAFVDQPYTYGVAAFEPNINDLLNYSLVKGPAGMSVDSITGELSWTPYTSDIGGHEVIVEVVDQDGNFDRVAYTLEVQLPEPNEVPEFTSVPEFEATVGRTYLYVPEATDADGDIVQILLGEYVPQGLEMFDGKTITWTPTADQVRDHTLIFEANDGKGGVALQPVTITVKDLTENSPPRIESTPQYQVSAGEDYSYQVVATDIDGGALSYFLELPPVGMSIDKNTGLIQWQVPETQINITEINVRVTDLQGAYASQKFAIGIIQPITNLPPNIESVPGHVITATTEYVYQVMASDPEGESLDYQILTSPVGMAMDANGLVSWVSTLEQLGSYEVALAVSDISGATARQSFYVTVSENNANPQITSTPNSVVAVNSLWEYQVTATDADGDFLTWKLANAQADMNITSSGLFSWIPPMSWVGQTVSFDIIVEDGRGGQAIQSLNVPVNYQANNAPVITSTPTYAAQVDAQYAYQITATDAEADAITFSLPVSPSGASINVSGLVNWTPISDQVGTAHTFKVIAQDAMGGQSIQTFEVAVNSTPTNNELPEIVSSPVAPAIIDIPYEYQVIAKDANSDALSYELISAPTGMTIDANGLIRWQAAIEQEGQYAVTIRASDQGGYTQQSYVLPVIQLTDSTNQYPEITSTPVYSAAIGNTYEYQVNAIDADGDELTYALVSGPTGMAMDTQGRISWSPTTEQVAKHGVEITVSDSLFYATQTFEIQVRETPLPLEVSVQVNPTVVTPGQEASITVFTRYGLGTVTRELWVDGQPITLDQYGSATFATDTAGSYGVSAKATDQLGEEITQAVIIVTDVHDPIPPVIDLSAMDDLDVVTAPVDIIATIEDENLIGWRVIVKEVGAAPTEYQVIATGTGTTTNGVLTRFDPTMLINGQYVIIVEATDVNNNVTQGSITVRVEGDLKVGNFSITLQDLHIPLAGIPIQVSRTYDSRQKHKLLDFGYGWSVDYQNIKVEESRKPGKGWVLQDYPGFMGILNDYCVEPLGAPEVTITLPDGQQEVFEAQASPKCTEVYPALDVSLVFNPVDDTLSKLEPLNNAYGRLVNGDVIDLFGSTFDALNPSRYKLTTKNGFEYILDEEFGIEIITDPNGNTVTYSADGIVHSAGKSIDFVRNDDGLITQIIDPQGNVTTYDYQNNFDLKSITDAENASASYTYNSRHGLVDMIDPLGRKLVKNIYDDSGRLIAQEDGDGNRTDFNHDLEGRQSIVKDRLGRSSFLYYNDKGNITSQVDALGNVTSFAYDANGNQTSKNDALGRITQATFNERNDQLTATDALGNTITYTYSKLGKELTITDASGDVYSNTYDNYGNLLKVVDPLDKEVSNNLNRQGLPSLVRDALGNDTTYTYDEDGNKLTETNSLDEKTTYTYDESGNVLTESKDRTLTDNSVVTETRTYEYDNRNRLLKTIYADGTTSSSEYDVLGNVTAIIDTLNRRTEMEYDLYGRVTKTIYHDATEDSKTYDLEGNVLTQVDRLNRTTSFEYDALNRVIKTTAPNSSATQTEYDAVGQVTAEVDALGNRTEFEYDLAGRRIKTKDALGNEHHFAYDVDGNLISETDALGHTTTYVYDKLDRKIETVFHNVSTIKTGLDALGRKISATDQAATVTQYQYDKLGRLTKVISPKADPLDDNEQANVTSYTYDEVGNKLSQTDALGRTTSWSYDAQSRVLSRTLPLGQVEIFTYGVAGNVITRTDFNGDLITYVYDESDRVTSIFYGKDSSVESFTYDDLGNRLTSISNQGTWTYSYDVMNRLVTETQPSGDKLAYTYDANGNKTELTITYANGDIRVERSTYDVLNRLKTVKDADGNTTSYEYDAVGNRSKVTHSNANVTNYVYDELNRLTKLQTQSQDGIVLQQFDYSLHTTGRREKITELTGRVTDYTYDHLYRLTNENITDAINGDYSAEYQFDKVGNRTYETVDGVSTAYSYDLNDRITSQGGAIYSYDDNGNTLTESLDGDVTSYTYNAQNKMSIVSKTVDSVTTNNSYAYNPDGIRFQKTESNIETNFLVDSNRDYQQVVAEIDASDQVKVEYTFGDDLLSQKREGVISSYHYDGLGSTRALSDSSGLLTDTYDYEAFGEVLNETGDTQNSYKFTGEQFDASLDQYYLRARYYDQNSGRFTQQDTWMGRNYDPVTLHKYMYANADPVTYTDPTGNFGLASIGASLRINGILSTSASVGGRSAISRVLTGSGKEAFGIMGEEIIGFAKEALFKVLLQEMGGPGFKNAGAKGTAAHLQFEKMIESINNKYKRYGYTIHAEIFRDKGSSSEAKRRAKDSLGIDVEVRNSQGKPVLSFDLKTGRGTSKKKNRRLQGVFGTDIIEIFVSKK